MGRRQLPSAEWGGKSATAVTPSRKDEKNIRVSKIKTRTDTTSLSCLLYVYFYRSNFFFSLVFLSYFGIFAFYGFFFFFFWQRCKNKRYDNNIWHTAICVIHWHSVTVMVMTTPNALNGTHIPTRIYIYVHLLAMWVHVQVFLAYRKKSGTVLSSLYWY